MEQQEERRRLDGYRCANTKELRFLIQEAKELEYDRLFPEDVVFQLDPNGNHLLCARTHLIPGADASNRNEDGTGYTVVEGLTMDSPMPCEVMTKLKGVDASANPEKIPTFWLDVKVETFMKLDTMEESRQKLGLYKVLDGEHRGKR